MSKRNWTESQRWAISARNGSLLVSAAAGSGKTAVLVQRVIERLTDPERPCDADRLLIVTFTNAAAAEMKERISAAIGELLQADPANAQLQRQQILLNRAHISTIHSFCNELVRENFYKLDISPDFRISDSAEMTLLRQEAMDEVMEELYAKEDGSFQGLSDAFSFGRDDRRLMETVETLYDFIRSHPFPERWLDEKEAMYRADLPAGETQWGKIILDYAQSAVDYMAALTQNSLSVMEDDEKISAAYREAFLEDLSSLEELRDRIVSKDWNRIAAGVQAFGFAKLKALRGYRDDPLKLRIAGSRDTVKSVFKKLASLFQEDEEKCRQDIRRLVPVVSELFGAVKRFSQRLDEKKQQKRLADFGDLEHWALRLLVRQTEEGWRRTEDARLLAESFDEVMVDEYQDTNEAQDMIFRAISREEKNLFMVGDVKQSIYRFRQAMPEIFLRRKASYPDYDPEKNEYPAKVNLDRNFRSRHGVTDGVNFVFRQLMSVEMGEMEYTREEELMPGASYPEREEADTELHILTLPKGADMDTLEAEYIGSLIASMVRNGELVQDGGKQRPAAYRDFCVLIRNANAHGGVYAAKLREMGIPAWSDTAGTFFGTPEVSVALSYLRVLDNPVQDIPLLSVLISPIWGFTPDDLAQIRMARKGDAFYFALKDAAERPDVLGARCRRFLEHTEAFRRLAATLPADRLIQRLYEATGYPAVAQAMRQGDLRLNNLRLLMKYARDYEGSGYQGLSGFIRFIDRLQEQDSDLAPAASLSESANVVRVMSIHKSKGLEFPICILANTARQFNKRREDILLHPALGLGMKLRDETMTVQYDTMPREAVSLEIERGGMSEELRVLYVAMTRAKEKLVMLTSLDDPVKTLGKLGAQLTDSKAISPYVVRSAGSFSDWILSCALRHPSGGGLREKAGVLPGVMLTEGENWKILLNPVREQQETISGETEKRRQIQADPELTALLQKRFSFVYPGEALKSVPAKVAASELAGKENAKEYAAMSRPAFLTGQTMTPAERGTALHLYMQFADYRLAKQDPEKQLRFLLEKGFLTQEQAEAVSLKKIERFFQSGLYRRMEQSENLRREIRFTVELAASEVNPGLTGQNGREPVVLQGAVDCVFEENGGLILVDYKTDYVKEEQELKNRYRRQLSLYALALEQTTGLKVTEQYLYSFSLGEAVRIN